MTIPAEDVRVIVQALSRCAAERRIAEARTLDPEVRSFQDAQARRYEEVIQRLPQLGLSPPDN